MQHQFITPQCMTNAMNNKDFQPLLEKSIQDLMIPAQASFAKFNAVLQKMTWDKMDVLLSTDEADLVEQAVLEVNIREATKEVLAQVSQTHMAIISSLDMVQFGDASRVLEIVHEFNLNPLSYISNMTEIDNSIFAEQAQTAISTAETVQTMALPTEMFSTDQKSAQENDDTDAGTITSTPATPPQPSGPSPSRYSSMTGSLYFRNRSGRR